jgi:hypothetical protein
MEDAVKTEVFEIHITGDQSIHEAASPLLLKTIQVELLRPDGSLIRTEHMTSHAVRFGDIHGCLHFTKTAVACLKKSGVEIVRVKIESPYYSHYVDNSLYVESHFDPKGWNLPVSRNPRKGTLMATDRVYDHSKYKEFVEKYSGETIELCLLDTNCQEDSDWFDSYEVNQSAGKVSV